VASQQLRLAGVNETGLVNEAFRNTGQDKETPLPLP
jgi:hypothetical protein